MFINFEYFVNRPNKLWPATYILSPANPEIWWPAFLPLAGRVLFQALQVVSLM
jgi:hypothetical protein